MEDKYMIVRFWKQEGKASKIIQTGLSLEEAQEYCSKDNTKMEGVFFDGYTKQDSQR